MHVFFFSSVIIWSQMCCISFLHLMIWFFPLVDVRQTKIQTIMCIRMFVVSMKKFYTLGDLNATGEDSDQTAPHRLMLEIKTGPTCPCFLTLGLIQYREFFILRKPIAKECLAESDQVGSVKAKSSELILIHIDFIVSSFSVLCKQNIIFFVLNSKCRDQPVHPRSLIRALSVR